MPVGIYPRKKRSASERFQQKIQITRSGCWEWIGYRTPDGYGHFWMVRSVFFPIAGLTSIT